MDFVFTVVYPAISVILFVGLVALVVLLFVVLLAALRALKTYVRVQELKIDLMLADED
jgi:hypothetical protein